MSFTELQIFNMALAEVGSAAVDAISDKDDISGQQLSNLARDKTLGMYDWKFARKRTRVSAAGILDASAITITFVVNSGADTITDSSNTFLTTGALAGDRVTVSGSASNNNTYDIASAVAGTLTLETHEDVTAEALASNSDLKLFYSPASRWGYKYARPSDCVRVMGIGQYLYAHYGSNDYSFNYYGAGHRYNIWDIEGNYIVSNIIDDNDQLAINYIQSVTDTALFTDLFVNVDVYQLAALLVIPLAKDRKLKADLELKALATLNDGLASMAGEGPYEEERPDTSWQKAGRRGSHHSYGGHGDRW